MKTIARFAPYAAIVAGLVLLLAAAAHAQNYPNGLTARETYPSTNPYTQPGSYANPYVLQNQRGQQVGTMTETYRSTNPYTQPGSAANPYRITPSPYYNQR